MTLRTVGSIHHRVGAMSNSVVHVLALGSIAQIYRTVVVRLPVVMKYLEVSRSRTQKRLGDQYMNWFGLRNPITQIQSHLAATLLVICLL